MAEQFISVGKIGKPHGLRGAFRFLLHYELKNRKKFPKHFMLKQNGNFIPWFIKEYERTGFNEGIITFEEITSPEKARQHNSNELFLSENDFIAFFKKGSANFNHLVGFTAIDHEAGKLGIVETITESPGQLLCSVKNGKKEIIIPVIDEFVLKVDKRKKEIIFNLPEGLLDL